MYLVVFESLSTAQGTSEGLLFCSVCFCWMDGLINGQSHGHHKTHQFKSPVAGFWEQRTKIRDAHPHHYLYYLLGILSNLNNSSWICDTLQGRFTIPPQTTEDHVVEPEGTMRLWLTG